MKGAVTTIENRPGVEGAATATARSVAYALFSRLLASPWDDTDPGAALPPSDLESILDQLAAALPATIDFAPLAAAAAALTSGEVGGASAGNSSPKDEPVREVAGTSRRSSSPNEVGGTSLDTSRGGASGTGGSGPGEEYGAGADELVRVYSGLFEVGSDGPPVPLREGLVEGRPSSTREEIVRFYDFFGFDLQDDRQWQPDHLSVELEFVHFLAFREAAAMGESDSDRTQPQHLAQALRLGQLDFLDRHLLAWVPATADRLAARVASEPSSTSDGASLPYIPGTAYYAAVLRALADFLIADADWQRARVSKEN